MADEMQLPRRPFFSCEEAAFSIVDGDAMRQSLLAGPITPAVTLRVGPGNIFEHRPRRVVEHQGPLVGIECDNGATVYLDFEEGAARTHTPEGDFLYMGGIDEGNDGKGFIRTG